MSLKVCRRVQYAVDQGARLADRVVVNSRYQRLHVHKFRIRNCVGAFTYHQPINIERLFSDYHSTCSPFSRPRLDFAVFPGFRSSLDISHPLLLPFFGDICIQSAKRNISVTIFKSGKIIITGAKQPSEIDGVGNFLAHFLDNFLYKISAGLLKL